MDIAYFSLTGFTAYAYIDTLPRGFGFHSEGSYHVLRLGRIVLEIECP